MFKRLEKEEIGAIISFNKNNKVFWYNLSENILQH